MSGNPCTNCVPPTCFKSVPLTETTSALIKDLHSPLASAATPKVEVGPSSNAVLDMEFADPGALRVGSNFYAYASNAGHAHVQVARSLDLFRWEYLQDALPTLPSWAVQSFKWTWAPAVTSAPEGYVMYVATRCRRRGTQCIGLAMSDRPEGPFEPLAARPLACMVDQGGSIDPSTFVDDDGTRYLIWKTDGNAIGLPTWICIQKLGPDGLTLLGQPVRLIKNDLAWEGKMVEAPTLWKHGSKYFLFYSANHFTGSRYAVGYAVSDSVWGPFVKAPRPLWTTDRSRRVVGPGGQDIVVGPDSQTWILYHAWSPGGYRNLHVGRLRWQEHRPKPTPEQGLKYLLDSDLKDSADARFGT